MSVSLRVRDYMTTDLVTVLPRTDITQVVQILITNDISGVLVVSDTEELVGILTERDCIATASSAGYYDQLGGPASDFMSTPVETVAPDENLVNVAIRMTDSPYRRFPVLEDGRLVGLISRRDVLRALGSGSWFAKNA
ncbi:MAG: CBS domain-containing protein [Gammaproteobacteria bacterium]|nr:CBS domain-containing protein [Gammaproteobacteria bacterium]